MRTSIFYIVAMTGLALAVLLAIGVGAVWTHLTEQRLPRAHVLRVMTSRRTRPPASGPRTHQRSRC